MRFKINTSIRTKSYIKFTIIIAMLASKLIEFAEELVGLSITGEDLKVKNDKLLKAITRSKGRDTSATVDETTISDSLRADYRTIALFVENSINLSGNESLAVRLTLEISKKDGKKTIAPISVFNTSTKGKVRVKLAKVKKAHSYIVEYSQLAEDGTVISCFEKTFPLTKDYIEDLVQGGNYRFRAHAVKSGHKDEEWTAYVIHRVS